jgi:oligosaccharyltransferase complex subunit beta
MRVLLSFLILGLLGIASALSTSGNRLLVVLEELAEKEKYSKFFGDLKGKRTAGRQNWQIQLDSS